MKRLMSWPLATCVVVHSNPLVSEDLRQLLVSEGARDVAIFTRIDLVTPSAASVVFVEGSATVIVHTPQVQAWQAFGTPIIAMNGAKTGAEPFPHVFTLEQPFSTQHVRGMLLKIKRQ